MQQSVFLIVDQLQVTDNIIHVTKSCIEYTQTRLVWFMVFNATFNNISVISVAVSWGWGNRSARRKLETCRKSLTKFITLCSIDYTSPWTGFELTTLVVIGTNCINPSTIGPPQPLRNVWDRKHSQKWWCMGDMSVRSAYKRCCIWVFIYR